MNLLNATKMQAGFTMGMKPDGRELLVVAVKGTFDFPTKPGDAPRLAAEQVPLVEADQFTGEPGFSAPLYESDYAPSKPACDVLLNGSAYAPGGAPATRVTVALRIGSMRKSFDVVGNRKWIGGIGGYSASRPEPFVRMPISYDTAFGGSDTSHPDESKHAAHSENPIGVGFHSNLQPGDVQGKPLPNTEETGRPVGSPDGRYRPMSFGPVGRGWRQRLQYAGTYDQNWLDKKFPFLPDDFDERYYQAAPVDQQVPVLEGGEDIELVNLTPEGRTTFPLPEKTVPVLFIKRDGQEQSEVARIDSLVLEPDLGRLTLTWRATIPLQRNVFEISLIVAGEMSRAWHRARQLGKTYYPSLKELVGARED